MAGKVEGEWTLMVEGAGEAAARTAIEVAAVEAVGADWEKLMLRSTGVAEEAACMVYLAISKLALMRYWATLMLAGEPVIVTWRMAEPSAALAILM